MICNAPASKMSHVQVIMSHVNMQVVSCVTFKEYKKRFYAVAMQRTKW
jgi:hypothetical protein